MASLERHARFAEKTGYGMQSPRPDGGGGPCPSPSPEVTCFRGRVQGPPSRPFPSTQTRGSQPVDSSPSGMFSVLPSAHPQGLAPKLPPPGAFSHSPDESGHLPHPAAHRNSRVTREGPPSSAGSLPVHEPSRRASGAAGADGRERESRHGVCRETGVGGTQS